MTIIVAGRSESGAEWRGRKAVAVGGNGRLVLHSQYLLGHFRSKQASGGFAPCPREFTVSARGRDGGASAPYGVRHQLHGQSRARPSGRRRSASSASGSGRAQQ